MNDESYEEKEKNKRKYKKTRERITPKEEQTATTMLVKFYSKERTKSSRERTL